MFTYDVTLVLKEDACSDPHKVIAVGVYSKVQMARKSVHGNIKRSSKVADKKTTFNSFFPRFLCKTGIQDFVNLNLQD